MSVARHWRETPGRYNLVGTRCGSCGKVYFPRRSLCPECRRASLGKMESYKLKDEGTVFTYSVIHEAPIENSILKPYAVAMVMTGDGVLITAQLVDVDIDKIHIGMPVRAVLRKIGEDGREGIVNYGYKFTPKS
ncbi:MAG: Zn-ribbon domain-containing OB-fold protein [Methanomassiliicoccaceae archaeon]|jgi:uncharacterized OB-fold protein|nr:Zn-ribbon domain-containing OB-fold protein [Methanomassiliicoccaceae archaeon]